MRIYVVSDYLNGKFKPAVDFLDKIIFRDVAKALGFDLDFKVPFIVVWLIIGGMFFTFRLRFINFRGFAHGWQIVSGKFSKKEDDGEVTHFQVLTTTLSTTVGLGNIAVVAVAISLGGRNNLLDDYGWIFEHVSKVFRMYPRH